MIDLGLRGAALLAVVSMAMLSCGNESAPNRFGAAPAPPDMAGRNLVEPGYAGRFQVVATVLESPEHGPQLCDAVAESYPPQCGGPDIVGWDWEAVDGEESEAGITWGVWRLIGTWDGERFMLAAQPQPQPRDGPGEPVAPDFTSPCPEPEGGWRSVDPDKATDAALTAAFARAAESEEYAGGWIDQSYLDELGPSAQVEGVANDPSKIILNVRFTGNLSRHEREIRAVWGGALCISGASRTEADLNAIQEELHRDYPRLQSSGHDVVLNAVVVSTWLATTDLQAEFDDKYGRGTVVLHGHLEPID